MSCAQSTHWDETQWDHDTHEHKPHTLVDVTALITTHKQQDHPLKNLGIQPSDAHGNIYIHINLVSRLQGELQL